MGGSISIESGASQVSTSGGINVRTADAGARVCIQAALSVFRPGIQICKYINIKNINIKNKIYKLYTNMNI